MKLVHGLSSTSRVVEPDLERYSPTLSEEDTSLLMSAGSDGDKFWSPPPCLWLNCDWPLCPGLAPASGPAAGAASIASAAGEGLDDGTAFRSPGSATSGAGAASMPLPVRSAVLPVSVASLAVRGAAALAVVNTGATSRASFFEGVDRGGKPTEAAPSAGLTAPSMCASPFNAVVVDGTAVCMASGVRQLFLSTAPA
jgi:hypothetical protein